MVPPWVGFLHLIPKARLGAVNVPLRIDFVLGSMQGLAFRNSRGGKQCALSRPASAPVLSFRQLQRIKLSGFGWFFRGVLAPHLGARLSPTLVPNAEVEPEPRKALTRSLGALWPCFGPPCSMQGMRQLRKLHVKCLKMTILLVHTNVAKELWQLDLQNPNFAVHTKYELRPGNLRRDSALSSRIGLQIGATNTRADSPSPACQNPLEGSSAGTHDKFEARRCGL